MTFMSDLRRELARQGVDARRARRIVAELEDHLACDPNAQLGSPGLIASRFAAELRLAQTRRATYGGFAALAVIAVLLVAASSGISAAGGWPTVGGARAAVVVLGGLAIIVGGQVSFVAGVLALWLIRRTGSELRLAQRRMRVALAAAAVAVAGEAAHAAAFRTDLPAWWFALATSAAVISVALLVVSGLALQQAGALTPPERITVGGVPPWFVLATGIAVGAAMTVGTAHAERSWVEGLIRGGFEVVAFAAGFFALGRFLGLRASVRHRTVPTVRQ